MSQPPAPPKVVPPSNATNLNIWYFLEYFSTLPTAPNYAVLVKGRWGAGKTHLVTSFFDARPEIKTIYVSLYGMRSIADIEAAFFTQLHPNLSTPGMKIVAAVVKGVLKNAKIDVDVFTGGKVEANGKVADFKLPKFLMNAGERILIFDDLERSKMPLKEVLGYINTFVEHDDSKVILIANEEQILKPDPDGKLTEEGAEYKETKEKLVGKSFAIEADLPGAYEGFLLAVADNDIRQFFTVKRSEIETMFEQSETNNLRFLRQTMLDFERLTAAMAPEHRRNIALLGDIMPPFFALSFEMKANRIEVKDVAKFGTPDWGHVLSGKAEAPQTRAAKRYPQVKFENAILGMTLLRNLLFDSMVDGVAIKDLIARSKYYADADQEPIWRTVQKARSLSDKEAQAAVDKMEAMFKVRAFSHQGEMLQIFGERLWLSRIQAIATPLADVVAECKKYIDDAYAAKMIDPAKSIRDVLGNVTDYEGLSFMQGDTGEFGEIATYLHAAEDQAKIDSYPEKSKALLKTMETQIDLYVRQLTLSNSEDNIYSQVPILTAIDKAEFVARVMALPPEIRRTALMPFSQRYTYLNMAPQLIPELIWLENVEKLLRVEIAKLPPIAKDALTGALGAYVTTPLAAAKAMAAAVAPALAAPPPVVAAP